MVILRVGAGCRVRLPLPQLLQIRHGLPEPGVVGAGVVHHQIQYHPDAPLPAGCQQGLHVLHGAVVRIDGAVVRYIVLVVRGAGMHRHQPDAIHAQLLQIVQSLHNPTQVADAVSVGIPEGVDEDLIPGAEAVVGAFPQGVDLRKGLLRPGCSRKIHSRPRRLGGGGWVLSWTGSSAPRQQQRRQQQAEEPCRPSCHACVQDVFETLTQSDSGNEISNTLIKCKELIVDIEVLRKALKKWYAFRKMPDSSKRMVSYYRNNEKFGLYIFVSSCSDVSVYAHSHLL